jgi:hypothetical protein
MKQKFIFIIELNLNKDEIEEIKERFRQNAEISKEDFNRTTVEKEAILDLFYFGGYHPIRNEEILDLRSNVKIRKKENKSASLFNDRRSRGKKNGEIRKTEKRNSR